MTLNNYKGTRASWRTVEVDVRPGTVHEGQEVPIPPANNKFMKVITCFILVFRPLHTSVEYNVAMDTFEHFYEVHLPQYMDTIADLKKALVAKWYPNSPIYNYMTGDRLENCGGLISSYAPAAGGT